MRCFDQPDKDGGQTPLYIACDRGHPEIVKLLLDNGCDVTLTRNDGLTALNATCIHIADALSVI